MKKIFNKDNSGVTLIELIIVVALIGIVISVIFSMFFFGSGTFSRGESQYGLQNEARLAIDSLSRDLRFVREIEIVDDFDAATPEPYETIVYFDSVNNQIVKTFAGITTTYNLNTTSSNPLVFKKTSSNTLHYKLDGQDDGQDYILQSDLLLLNVVEIDVSNLTDTTDLTGEVILFKTPEAFRAQTLAPTVSLPNPNLNTATKVELIYNQPTTAYLNDIGIAIESNPLNTNPLTVSDITIKRFTLSLESKITLDIDLSGIILMNDERIILTIYDSVEVDTDGNPIPQHIVMMAYNDSTPTWDLQN
ncbi:MAG: prepilin-type N-terminal cleavage/methylation domain-containing protein [Bacillota bacterium]|nr:prepilin-type N-terminal cleavage/methylation domain-containing protein [Bacillota bacterium]